MVDCYQQQRQLSPTASSINYHVKLIGNKIDFSGLLADKFVSCNICHNKTLSCSIIYNYNKLHHELHSALAVKKKPHQQETKKLKRNFNNFLHPIHRRQV